jgi:hypothetical protein
MSDKENLRYLDSLDIYIIYEAVINVCRESHNNKIDFNKSTIKCNGDIFLSYITSNGNYHYYNMHLYSNILSYWLLSNSSIVDTSIYIMYILVSVRILLRKGNDSDKDRHITELINILGVASEPID